MIEPNQGPTYEDAEACVMTTRSQKRVSLLEPKVSDMDIEDIATGLSNICRFTGQCNENYNVAEHSVRVMQYMGSEMGINDPTILHAGLMHDAAEAYTNDIARPLKCAMRALGSDAYDRIERGFHDVIAIRWSLQVTPAVREMVKHADNMVYVAEAELYMTGEEPGALGEALDHTEARALFLTWHDILCKQRGIA